MEAGTDTSASSLVTGSSNPYTPPTGSLTSLSTNTKTWKEIQRRHVISDLPGISFFAFDPLENLIWTGSASGQVTSFLETGESMIRYTSFPAHGSAVSQILVNESGVHSLSNQNVRLSHRRGLQLWNKVVPGASAMTFTDLSSELLVSSSIPCKLMVLNVFRGNVVKEAMYESPIVKMKRAKSKLICAGLQSGSVNLIDPRQLRTEHTLFAHTAGIADMDVYDNTVVTCGYSVRSGTLAPDPMVKIYDLRMMRSLSPVPFQAGPAFLQFVPGTTSTIAALSPAGAFQICDLTSKNFTNVSFHQIQMDGYLTSMHFSSSGSTIGFGDSTGLISLWSNNDSLTINEFVRPSEYRTFNSYRPPSHLRNDCEFSQIGMPYYTSTLLSAWPSDLTFPVGRPGPKIPEQVLEKVKMVDVVGYAPNPGTFKRNQNVALTSMSNRETPLFRSEQERHRMRTRTQELRPATPSTPDPSVNSVTNTDSGVPNSFLKVEIKYSRFGVEDFDFGFYNKTEYSGLETHIQNSYTNSILQTLFFSNPLKDIVTSHLYRRCGREPCLTCELGFLFRMLEDAKGVNCHASNFLRALATFKQAAGLGLLEHFENIHHGNHATMIQTFCRFILENIGSELSSATLNHHQQNSSPESRSLDGLFQTLFGSYIMNTTTCSVGHEQKRESRAYVTDLVYTIPRAGPSDTKSALLYASPTRSGSNSASQNPSAGSNGQTPTFVDLVQHSMNRISSTKAWCTDCKEYQMIQQAKNVVTLPQYLFFNVLPTTEAQTALWIHDNASAHTGSVRHFLPSRICLARNEKELKVFDLSSEELDEDHTKFTEVANYSLKSIICEIRHAKHGKHLVGLINTGSNDETKWHLFNDFLIEEVSAESAKTFTSWKIPVIVQYARDQTDSFSPLQAEISPIERDLTIFVSNPLLNLKKDLSIKYKLLKPDELPKTPGFLCALDAEFVSLSHAETEIRSDGTKSVIRPSRFSLARVSVVRGDGPMEGVPFIDDYIATSETVVDYLTEFSGIKPGDLDPPHSRYPLVPLKYAYLKLRTLVDMGCIFVGHGLAKDFRTINIVVPPEQVIDTVFLFRFKNRHRKLSLKFLSWCLFREDIQTEAHDSVIDAQMALRLYKKYLELQEEGTFEKTMEDIYEEGRIYNFKPPSATVTPSINSNQGQQVSLSSRNASSSSTSHVRHHSGSHNHGGHSSIPPTGSISPGPRSHHRNFHHRSPGGPTTPSKNRQGYSRQRYPSFDPHS